MNISPPGNTGGFARVVTILACVAVLIAALWGQPASAQVNPCSGRAIVPIFRVHPSGASFSCDYGRYAPTVASSSNIVSPYGWSQVTLAYDRVRHAVLVGCRGLGHQLIIIRYGGRRRMATCDGNQPWQAVLRNVPPDAHIHVAITFQ